MKELCCCHLLSARWVGLNQNKDLLEIFPFHSNNCRKMFNIRTGTESVNPCTASCHVFKKMYQSLEVIHLLREFSFVNDWPTKLRYFWPGQLSELLIVVNINHTANKILNGVEPLFCCFWIKLYSNDNYFNPLSASIALI